MGLDRSLVFADGPSARRPMLRWIAATAIVLGALHVILIIVVRGSGPVLFEAPWVVIVSMSFLGLAAASIAFLALGRYPVLGDPISFWIGITYAAVALLAVPRILTWPALVPGDRGVVSVLPNTSVWIGQLSVTLGTVGLMVAVLAYWPGRQSVVGRHWKSSVAVWLLLVATASITIIGAEARLPKLIEPNGRFAPVLAAWEATLVVVLVLGAWLSTRRYRHSGDPLVGYVAIAQILVACGALAAMVGGKRYDLWFLWVRILVGGGSLTIMFGLLAEYVQLYRRELEKGVELTRARAEAEAANRTKDEFLAMLGHELRNPLAAILNAAAVLHHAVGHDERLARVTDIVARQTKHLGRMVDDLLDASRIGTGRLTIRRNPVDLKSIVEDAVDAFRPAAAGRRVTVALESAIVNGDRDRMAQVISNLLDNAVKHTHADGHIDIVVRREGMDVLVVVTDDGEGIDRSALPSVFEPFVQTSRAFDRPSTGLGLGLSLVRSLVELHGGIVTAASEGLGRGATFTVRLPGLSADTPSADAQQRERPRARRCRVVVIEDDADVRTTLSAILEGAGYQVYEADDGEEGFKRLIEVNPELALIDIGLPRLDGYEIARRARRELRHPVTLIALTGFGQREDVRRARDAGFDHHLTKPVDPDRLLGVIEESVSVSDVDV